MDALLGTRVRRVYMQAPFDSGDKQVNMKLLAYAEGQTDPKGFQMVTLNVEA